MVKPKCIVSNSTHGSEMSQKDSTTICTQQETKTEVANGSDGDKNFYFEASDFGREEQIHAYYLHVSHLFNPSWTCLL